MNAKMPEWSKRTIPIFKEEFCYVMDFAILGQGKETKLYSELKIYYNNIPEVV